MWKEEIDITVAKPNSEAQTYVSILCRVQRDLKLPGACVIYYFDYATYGHEQKPLAGKGCNPHTIISLLYFFFLSTCFII